MTTESLYWLATIIASHPNHEVLGRSRLQKTIWLLQRAGLPTDYSYSLHFYGPYSEELRSIVRLAVQLRLVTETPSLALDGTEYFVLRAESSETLPDLGRMRLPLQLLAEQDSIVVELAASYDAFRKMGLSSREALLSMRAKKCDECHEARALDLVQKLGLETVASEAA